jgi:hypothetical protein
MVRGGQVRLATNGSFLVSMGRKSENPEVGGHLPGFQCRARGGARSLLKGMNDMGTQGPRFKLGRPSKRGLAFRPCGPTQLHSSTILPAGVGGRRAAQADCRVARPAERHGSYSSRIKRGCPYPRPASQRQKRTSRQSSSEGRPENQRCTRKADLSQERSFASSCCSNVDS